MTRILIAMLGLLLLASGLPARAECLGTNAGRITHCDGASTGSGNSAARAVDAISNMGDYLQDREDRKQAQEQAARETQERQQDAANAQANRQAAKFDQFVRDMGGDDWEAQARAAQQGSHASSAINSPVTCNCARAVGQCTATISQLKKTGKTGYSFRLGSTEPTCSRITYFIDNTPHLSVLNGKASSIEQFSSLKPVTLEQLGIDRCEICEQK